MKILVTGGTGFTGHHLVRRLVHDGHQVRSLDNQEGLFDKELKSLGVEIIYGSVTDKDAVERAMEGCEIVFHLAAAFRGVDLPKAVYWSVNVEGTRIVCNAAMNAGVKRLIYCSTEGVHGKVDITPADENAPINPKDYYEFSKYEGEKVVKEFKGNGLTTVILRPTAIYGPGDPGRFLMIFKQVKKGYFPMFGSGKITYHPVYIDNLVDAFMESMVSATAVGNAYLIGDEHYYSLIDLVTYVGKVMNKKFKFIYAPYWLLLWVSCACEWVCKPFGITPPLFKRRAEWYWENRGFSNKKAAQDLGYTPRIGIEEGLKRTYEWYVSNGYL
ncbi:MAG: NAD-dependent epimerase/dehydratase family protein [Candidatus Omnitrophica bacterium]|nr:NAD-dependent epimerase/dehydratase family protein [Candidatus Omnitrophota bacterium]